MKTMNAAADLGLLERLENTTARRPTMIALISTAQATARQQSRPCPKRRRIGRTHPTAILGRLGRGRPP